MPDPKSRTLEFMQRLAARMPRPRLHLIRFHGVLAPNTKLRSEIIPSPVEQATEPACDHAQAQGAPEAEAMRVVITGSSGQIGSNLAVRCLESGHQVIGIDFRRNEWTDAFEERPDGFDSIFCVHVVGKP